MCETFFCSTLTFRDNKHRNVGDVMDCYGHGILVKMCYAIVRKCIFVMKLTEFVQDIKKNVFMKGLLINSGCHSDEKAVFVKVRKLVNQDA